LISVVRDDEPPVKVLRVQGSALFQIASCSQPPAIRDAASLLRAFSPLVVGATLAVFGLHRRCGLRPAGSFGGTDRRGCGSVQSLGA
jgi:hypothetical protein